MSIRPSFHSCSWSNNSWPVRPGRGRLYRVKGGERPIGARVVRLLGRRIPSWHRGGEHCAVPEESVRHGSRKERKALEAPGGLCGSGSSCDSRALPVLRPSPFVATASGYINAHLWAGNQNTAPIHTTILARQAYRKAYATDLPLGTMWDANEEQPGRTGILTLMAGGSASHAARESLRTGGIEQVLSGLTWLGPAPRDLLAFTQISWETDPWAGGGYAAFTTSYDPALRQWLIQPHGRCFFAGEHTSVRWQGYMNGAVESGLRAALDVITSAQGRVWNRPSP